ncbi:MAG: RidA family protein [Sphingopyxis sp.]|nr:RidA family protein [Sphingopyxis sp.]
MTLIRHSSGSRFETLAAYSRAVDDGDYVHVSGTVGSNPDGTMPDSIEGQGERIFAIVEQALDQCGLTLGDVVRHRVYLTDAADMPAAAAILRAKFAEFPPANTTLICGIPAPGARIEIEFTARRRRPD